MLTLASALHLRLANQICTHALHLCDYIGAVSHFSICTRKGFVHDTRSIHCHIVFVMKRLLCELAVRTKHEARHVVDALQVFKSNQVEVCLLCQVRYTVFDTVLC